MLNKRYIKSIKRDMFCFDFLSSILVSCARNVIAVVLTHHLVLGDKYTSISLNIYLKSARHM